MAACEQQLSVILHFYYTVRFINLSLLKPNRDVTWIIILNLNLVQLENVHLEILQQAGLPVNVTRIYSATPCEKMIAVISGDQRQASSSMTRFVLEAAASSPPKLLSLETVAASVTRQQLRQQEKPSVH